MNEKGTSMPIKNDEMPPEYDLEAMGARVRGKHFEKYQRHVRMIQLNEDLAARYPDAEAVLAALRRDAATTPPSTATTP